MARAIIRWSISGERTNTTGNAIRGCLEDGGFTRVGTGVWETDRQRTRDVLETLQDALEIMKSPPGRGRLDHVWVYVDDALNN